MKIRPTMHERTARTAIELSVSAFSGVTDTIREAARMAPGRNLSPERLQGLCQGALREVIG